MPFWQIFHKVGIEIGQRTQRNAHMDQRKSESYRDESGNAILSAARH